MDRFRFDPPELSERDVRRVADDLYGVDGSMQRLRGERSHNTRFTTAAGDDYVLRVASASEPPAAIECQALAVVHIERMAPQLPITRLLPARNGQLVPTVEFDGHQHRVRLETFLPGTTFEEGQVLSDGALRAVGELLGGVAAALAFFEHPAALGFMPWDIANGLILDGSLRVLLTPEARLLVDRAQGRLESAQAAIERLPRQIVHNDGHAGNLLRSAPDSDQVTGLIDFGDVVHTVTVADIAVTAASLVPHQHDPIGALAALTAGYHGLRSLNDEEVQAVPDLVLARLVLSTLLIHYQIEHAPHVAGAVAGELPGTLTNLARWLDVDPVAAADGIAERL
jgi:Ser/Thr protein kinase RdoA (MazF antagonist)